MLDKLKDKSGAEAEILAFICGIVFITGIIMVSMTYQMRSVQRDYIANCLENTVRQICKNGEINEAIDNNLKNNLNKMFKSSDYKINYYCIDMEQLDTDIWDNAYVGSKFYIGDMVCAEFCLNINETNPTKEELKIQPAYSRIVNFLCGCVNAEAEVDRLLQLREGMVEKNAY